MTDRTKNWAEMAAECAIDAASATDPDDAMQWIGLSVANALLAIHDTLTAADRYAANEAKQREEAADASGDRSSAWAEYRREYQPNPRELNAAHKAFLAGWEARSEEEAECSRCGEQYAGTAEATLEHHRACTGETPENPMGYAANEARQREGQMEDAWQSRDWETVERLQDEAEQREAAPEPDPLDENDHRDRIVCDGGRIVRNGPRHWHTPAIYGKWCDGSYCGRPSLADWDRRFGPLTFAPDTAQDAARDDLSASEGESGDAEGPDTDNAQNAILCPECGHDIDDHNGDPDATGEWCAGCDDCRLTPSDVARALIEQAVEQAGGGHV